MHVATSVVVLFLPIFSVDEKEKYYFLLTSNVNNLDNREVKSESAGWKISGLKQRTKKISTTNLISIVN